MHVFGLGFWHLGFWLLAFGFWLFVFGVFGVSALGVGVLGIWAFGYWVFGLLRLGFSVWASVFGLKHLGKCLGFSRLGLWRLGFWRLGKQNDRGAECHCAFAVVLLALVLCCCTIGVGLLAGGRFLALNVLGREAEAPRNVWASE